MNLLLATLKKILFWSYDRGTWQYDVLCVLILAFIFLSPNGLFKIKNSKLRSDAQAGAVARNPQRHAEQQNVPSLAGNADKSLPVNRAQSENKIEK